MSSTVIFKRLESGCWYVPSEKIATDKEFVDLSVNIFKNFTEYYKGPYKLSGTVTFEKFGTLDKKISNLVASQDKESVMFNSSDFDEPLALIPKEIKVRMLPFGPKRKLIPHFLILNNYGMAFTVEPLNFSE